MPRPSSVPGELYVGNALAPSHMPRRQALEFLKMHPGITDGEYAAWAGITQPGAHQLLVRLQRDGLVRRERYGRLVRTSITAQGEAFLQWPVLTSRERVRQALVSQPSLSRRAVAAMLRLSVLSVQYHAARLR